MKLVMNVHELAEALGLEPGTVSKMCSESPEKLPPRLHTPYRRRQWSVEVVEKWVRDLNALDEPSSK